jgi:uncharacterized MnhB-related membrane protein
MSRLDVQILDLMRALSLLLVAALGAGVVRVRDPARQAVAMSFYGLTLALMFFVYQAPDVALSQIVVGAVATPLMVLLSLVKIRRNGAARALAARQPGAREGSP